MFQAKTQRFKIENGEYNNNQANVISCNDTEYRKFAIC